MSTDAAAASPLDLAAIYRDLHANPELKYEERGTADLVASGRDVTRSVDLFHRVNEQDFAACERTQPAMSSRAYRNGGVLVPTEHHIAEFQEWVVSRLGE